MIPFWILGVVAMAAAFASLIRYLKKRRREQLAFMARQLGLEYSPVDGQGCLELPFKLFALGDGRGVENVLWGTWQQMPVREFDYWFYTESTDTRGQMTRAYSLFSCAVTEIPAACSALTIGRENLLTRLASVVGMGDISFESDEFNRAFNVKATDRRFANDLIDQRMMQWLLTTRPEFHFETCGVWLLCFSGRRKPLDLVPLLGTLLQFRQRIPRVVYDLYPLDPAPPARARALPSIPAPPARADTEPPMPDARAWG